MKMKITKRMDNMKNNIYLLKKDLGFSLIELMIVVAIIAIIASVAFPSYQDSVIKARRSDGIEAALNCAAGLKKQFTITNSYEIVGNRPPECDPRGDGSFLSREGFYFIRLNQMAPTTFRVVSVPQGSQANDVQCRNLRITHTGLKNETGSGTTEDCWK